MSDEIRINRPAPAMQNPVVGSTPLPPTPSTSKIPWIILALVIVVLVVLGVLFRDRLFGTIGKSGADKTVSKSSGYQAVFLTNGQVYFGKISNVDGDYVDLKDIYYLQVIQPPLQGQQPAEGQQAQQQQQQPQLSLIKLGNELHGPVDEMKINRDHILFYEDLKEDGQVVKAIKEYQANPQNPGQGQQINK